jgi:hypothetical protein
MDAIENMGYAKHLQQRTASAAVRKKKCSLNLFQEVVSNSLTHTELQEYLSQSFNQFPYTSPECIISADYTRLPARKVADAACVGSSDLYDESPYTPVAHPN